jgi:hypothetical protein
MRVLNSNDAYRGTCTSPPHPFRHTTHIPGENCRRRHRQLHAFSPHALQKHRQLHSFMDRHHMGHMKADDNHFKLVQLQYHSSAHRQSGRATRTCHGAHCHNLFMTGIHTTALTHEIEHTCISPRAQTSKRSVAPVNINAGKASVIGKPYAQHTGDGCPLRTFLLPQQIVHSLALQTETLSAFFPSADYP